MPVTEIADPSPRPPVGPAAPGVPDPPSAAADGAASGNGRRAVVAEFRRPPGEARWRRATRRMARWAVWLAGAAALLAAVAPSLLSTPWGKDAVLWWVNGRIAGRVEVDQWSLGWWTGLRARGVRVIDPGGMPALTADRIDAVDVHLVSLFGDYPELGRVRVSDLRLQTRVLDGRNNLAAALSPPPEPEPERPAEPAPRGPTARPARPAVEEPEPLPFNVSGRLLLEDGGLIRAQPAPGAEFIEVRLLAADIDVPSLTDVSRYRITLAAPRGPSSGLVDLTGSGRLFRGNRIDWDGVVRELRGRVDRLDLSVVSDVAASLGSPVALRGTLWAELAIVNTGPAPTAKGTRLLLEDFLVFRPEVPSTRAGFRRGDLVQLADPRRPHPPGFPPTAEDAPPPGSPAAGAPADDEPEFISSFAVEDMFLADPEGRVAGRIGRLSGRQVDVLSLVSSRMRLGRLVCDGWELDTRRMPDGRNNVLAAVAELAGRPTPKFEPPPEPAEPEAERPTADAGSADAGSADAADDDGIPLPTLPPLPLLTLPETPGAPERPAVDVSGALHLRRGTVTARGGPEWAGHAAFRDIEFSVEVESLEKPVPYTLTAAAWLAGPEAATPAGTIAFRGRPLLFADGVFKIDGLLGGHSGHVRDFDLRAATAVLRSFVPRYAVMGTAAAGFELSAVSEGAGGAYPGRVMLTVDDLLVLDGDETIWTDPRATLQVAFVADPRRGVSRIRDLNYESARFGAAFHLENTTLSGLYGRLITEQGADPFALLQDAGVTAPLAEVLSYLNPAFAQQTQPTGTVWLRIEQLAIPVGREPLLRGRADLRLRVRGLKPAEGSFLAEILTMAGHDWKTVSASMDWTAVELSDGAVRLGRQVWDLGRGRELVFTGTVDLATRRLDLKVGIPLAERLVRPDGPKRIELPITGTAGAPEIDRRKAADALRTLWRLYLLRGELPPFPEDLMRSLRN